VLPVDAFARFKGGLEVVVDLAATTRYPAHGGSAGRVAA
jgi:hypothetical protein